MLPALRLQEIVSTHARPRQPELFWRALEMSPYLGIKGSHIAGKGWGPGIKPEQVFHQSDHAAGRREILAALACSLLAEY